MTHTPTLIPPQGIFLDADRYNSFFQGVIPTRAILLGVWEYISGSVVVIRFIGKDLGHDAIIKEVQVRELGKISDAEAVSAGWVDLDDLIFGMRFPFSINGNVNRKTLVTLLTFS